MKLIDKSALVAKIEKRATEAGLHDGVIAETREDECYSILSIIDTLEVKEVQEEPVSTKDKLLALSDGRLHLGWIDDAKVVEFEECLMHFHEDMNNIPQSTDSLTRLKDTDGVLHSYSKKLMSMTKEEPVSEELEKVVEEIAEPTILNAYGTKELARRLRNTICGTSVSEELEEEIDNYVKSNGYDGLDSIEEVKYIANHFAKWQKQQDQSTIELAEDHAMLAGMEKMKEEMVAKAKGGTVQKDYQIIMDDGTYIDLDPSMSLKPSLAVKEGERIKVIVIKED